MDASRQLNGNAVENTLGNGDLLLEAGGFEGEIVGGDEHI